jgi:preprotein translocase subunit SecD
MKGKSLVIIGLVAVLLAGLFLPVLYGQALLEIRAASATAIAGWQRMSAPDGGVVWVSPASTLTSTDIARSESRKQADGSATVGVVFTEAGARKMAALSAAQANKPIALLLDGKLVWAPVVRGTIEKEAVLSGVTPDVLQRVLATYKRQ